MPDVIIITSPGPQGPPGPPGSGSGANAFPYTGSAVVSGSLIITGSTISTLGFTGSLFGTASYSTQALSSSYALTASFALNGGGGSINTGSLLTTASVNLNTITFTKGNGSTFPITVNTGSGGGGGGGVGFPFSGSAVITGSLEIRSSGSNNILTITSQSNTLFQITNNITGNLFEVNSPVGPTYNQFFYISSSGVSEFLGPVLGHFTGSLLGTASYALNGSGGGGAVTKIIAGSSITVSPGSGVGDVTVSYAGGGGTFPFTGSASISGSIDLNGSLNSDTQNFNIINDTVIQNAVFNSSSINLTTYSNQVETLDNYWSYAYFNTGSLVASITSGSAFTIIMSNATLAKVGTKVFYSGSQSDGYRIPQFKFLGVVSQSYSEYFGGEDPYTNYYAVCVASITTSSLNVYPIYIRFYNTGSSLGSGTVNLNSITNVNGTLNVTSSITSPLYLASGSEFRGPLTITNTASINNLLIIGNDNLNKKYLQFGKYTGQYAVDANFINLARNAQDGFDVFGRLNTRLQFNQGFSYSYYSGEDVISAIGFNTLSYLDFQTDTTYNNVIDLNFVAGGYYADYYNGLLYTLPTKGFSTNYNGTTYFNVTGSVSASAYYGNGSNLTGILTNPFTGSFLITGSLNVNGPISSSVISSSVANLNTINSINGINTVYISKGSGSRTTNLVVGDTNALLTISGTGTSGQNLIVIGSGSLIAATTTFRNIALGNNVLPTITTNGSNNNIGIGFDVLTLGTTSLTNNIAIGNSASFGTTSGDNNIAIGTEALFSNTTQNNNIAVGLRAGKLATGAAASIFIGTDAGANVTSGDNNIAIGFEALKFLTTVNNNIAIGFQAMVSGSGAADSIAIGANTLSKITTGDFNLAIGANALATLTTANGNLAIGTSAMISSSATLASNNTSIGYQSLQQITGSNNVVVGYNTMQGFRSGSNNTVIGYNNVSGSGISGSNNTIIGGNIVLPDGVHNNRIIIADGQGTQRISVSGSITTISGSVVATSFSGSFTGSISATGSLTGSFTGSIFATGRVSQTVGTLSIVSSTASLDLSTGNFFTLTLAASVVTHINPTNITAGQTTTVLITTAAGSDVTFPPSVKQQSGSAYVTSPGSAKDILTFISYDTSNVYVANVKNLI